MANNILTPVVITREALRVLHSKLSFIGGVNRQYDDRYAQTGAKIGNTLNIRMPSKYSVRTNATLAAQDHYERSTPLSVSSQYGVDVSFTSAELTMSLDDFSKRIINPAMAQLAAKLESDALTAAYKLVPNYTGTGTTTSVITYKQFAQGGQALTEELAPYSDRTALLTPASKVEFLDATKGLFHDAQNIKEQYREGMMGRTSGFDVYENTLIPAHTTGTLAGSSVTTGASLGTSTTANLWQSQVTLSVTAATAGTTLLAGDIITVTGIFKVNEAKVSTGVLKSFVVQTAVTLTTATSVYDVVVKPGLMWGVGNGFQNASVPGGTTTNLAVALFGKVGTAFGQNLQFHKDAFVFATADLIDVSPYGAWGSRQTMDGISMRIAKQYTIASDQLPCRIDVLWGFGGLYPELAVRNYYTP